MAPQTPARGRRASPSSPYLPLLFLAASAFASHRLGPRVQQRLAPILAEQQTLRHAIDSLAAMSPAQVDGMRTAVQVRRAQIASLETGIPTSVDPADLLRRLDQRATRYHLSEIALRPDTSAAMAITGGAYNMIPYALTVRGEWPALVTLVCDLGASDRVLIPTLRTMKSVPDSAGLTASIRITLVTRRASAVMPGETADAATDAAPPTAPAAGVTP